MPQTQDEADPSPLRRRRFPGGDAEVDAIILPDTNDGEVAQDTEWCEITTNGDRERVRFHDYGRIFDVPGLYERLFYDILGCNSPQRVVGLLEDVLEERGVGDEELRVLDIGAGNGVVGEELAALDPERVVGLDILDEAERAAQRDRPDIYDDYVVADLTDLAPDTEEQLDHVDFNCLVSVATLGFNDIPPQAFTAAADLLATPGWLAFNLKEDFLEPDEASGFGTLIRKLQETGVIRVEAYRRYLHRLSITGEPLHYVAMVGRKLEEIPDAVVAEAAG